MRNVFLQQILMCVYKFWKKENIRCILVIYSAPRAGWSRHTARQKIEPKVCVFFCCFFSFFFFYFLKQCAIHKGNQDIQLYQEFLRITCNSGIFSWRQIKNASSAIFFQNCKESQASMHLPGFAPVIY